MSIKEKKKVIESLKQALERQLADGEVYTGREVKKIIEDTL